LEVYKAERYKQYHPLDPWSDVSEASRRNKIWTFNQMECTDCFNSRITL
jgi:hypothetical protein